jgi:hypothetical protein
MAERLKDRLLDRDKLADLVVGPDAYRQLPGIVASLLGPWMPATPQLPPHPHQQHADPVAVQLSLEETYAGECAWLAPAAAAAAAAAVASTHRHGCCCRSRPAPTVPSSSHSRLHRQAAAAGRQRPRPAALPAARGHATLLLP